jgi:hypothetical protein
MSDKIKIETGIPIPTNLPGAKMRYPWPAMQVGDSFFAPEMKSTSINTGKYLPKKFSARKQEGGGVIVWRIA